MKVILNYLPLPRDTKAQQKRASLDQTYNKKCPFNVVYKLSGRILIVKKNNLALVFMIVMSRVVLLVSH